jgi:single-stranded DNA-binding protein
MTPKEWRMNKVFLSGRITADVSRFGTDSKGGVMFTLVTSKPVIKDGKVQKDENGYTETYDQFHTVRLSAASARRSPTTSTRATSCS